MSGLSIGRFKVTMSIFASLLAYLVAPVATVEARTCEVFSNSFSCMSGMADKKAGPKKIRLASVRPTDRLSDVTPVVISPEAPTKANRRMLRKTRAQKRRLKRGKSSRRSRSKSGRRKARRTNRRNRNASIRKKSRSRRAKKGRRVVKRGWRTRNRGGQYMIARRGVNTSCFPSKLRGLLKKISRRYGRKLIITSGYRSVGHNRRVGGARRSQHIHCTAADFYIPGVNKMSLARYMKRLPGRGGVGTYCANRTVHLDVGPKRSWHWGCRRRHYARKHRARRRHYRSARKRSYKRRVASRRFRGARG